MKRNNLKGILIEHEMDFFRTYLNQLIRILEEKDADLEQKWEDSEDKERYFGNYYNYLTDCANELERHSEIVYSSFIIAIFNFLEYKLNESCRAFSIKNKSKATLKDINGHGIRRAKTFMEEICNFDLPSDDLWQELEEINEVRNCLIHSNGEINEENKKLLNYVKKSEGISIEENSSTKIKTISITEKYCSFAIKIIQGYLSTLAEKN